MKQPTIVIFGNEHKVKQIEFDKDGSIVKVVYRVNENSTGTVFKRDSVIDKSLTKEIKIEEPTHHPYHDYAHAPDLESLITNA